MTGNTQQTEAEKKAEAAKGKTKYLLVLANQDQRRRAGRAFGKEPVKIPLSELTKAHRKAIEDDPVLVTTEVSE